MVSAAVYQTPDWVSVSTQRSAQHLLVYTHKKPKKNEWTWFNLKITQSKQNAGCCYRRSRRGRCWGWGCSSTVWFRQPLRWNTALLYCSSPRSVQPPCGSNNELSKLLIQLLLFNSIVFLFLFLPVGPEGVDRFHIYRCTPADKQCSLILQM